MESIKSVLSKNKQNTKSPFRTACAHSGLLAISFSLISAQCSVQCFAPVHAAASSDKQKNEKSIPSGTLLLPLTPKLDTGSAPSPSAIAPLPPKSKKIASSNQSRAASQLPSNPTAAAVRNAIKEVEISASDSDFTFPGMPAGLSIKSSPVPPGAGKVPAGTMVPIVDNSKSEPAKPTDPEAEPDIAKLESESDNVLLKGTVQIVADDTEYDQNKNTFLGTGNAVATIAGQDARLEADMILYDQASETLDARGNVKIMRQGEMSTGSAFKFKVSSDEYLITNPDTEVQGTQVVARTGYGTKDGMRFKEGTMSLPEPVHIARNAYYGTMSTSADAMYKDLHPDAYMPNKPNFTFKARKMVYEKYKESGNLTVFGGKLQFGKFAVPLGKFNATVGTESRVTFPVTPFIGNNIMTGGVNVGPMFNSQIGKDGVFSWAPLIQYGGRRPSSTNSDVKKGNVGVGFRVAYTGRKMSANLAYGSNSNLLVGDVKYQFNERQLFQAGINRFINNGLFGQQRARAIAEVVDQRGISNIPLMTGISFRTSFGGMSDQPALLNQTPEYKQLFNITHGNIVNGFRLQEQIMGSSQPLFSYGNQKLGASMSVFGGSALRAYSSGDSMLMAQMGPVFNLNLNRVHLQSSVMKSGVKGQSPFIFDQFIQGSQSGQFGGDVRICKWLALGGNVGYNFDTKMAYQKSISAAIGPEDFKFLVTHDTIRGINRFGFDFMYGQPVPFNKLVLKGSPDRGQLGGM